MMGCGVAARGEGMRILIGLALVALGSSAANAKPREVRRLAPSSAWVVNYADDSCSLARTFGTGDRLVTVFFDLLEPGDSFNLLIIGNSLEGANEAVKPTLRFGPTEAPDEVNADAGTTDGRRTIIFQGGQRIAPLTKSEQLSAKQAAQGRTPVELPAIGPAREKAATWLEIGKLFPYDLVLETGAMDQPLAALRACAWDLVGDWGLNVDQHKRLMRKVYPVGSSFDWFDDDDYPVGMLRYGHEAIVNYRVLVDENGRASSCRIQTSTRPKAFDDVVCKLIMKRARFHPALDARGKPVRSFWRQTVTFRLAS